MCLMSQTCSPVPRRKMIRLHGGILPPWGFLLTPCLCHRHVCLPRGGTSLAPSPELVPKPGLLQLAPEACDTSAVCRVPGKERVSFVPDSHLFLQAFKARCAGGVCSASPVPKGSRRACVWTDLYLHKRHHNETAG